MLRVLCLFAVSVVTVACGKETSFVAKDFPCLVDLPGWNQDLMNMHKQLYLGYVNSANELTKKLQQIVQEGKEKSLEFGALKRRLAWEMDGMRLHELYFENLGRKGNPSSLFIEKVSKDFGSFDAWKQDFIATGLMRGIGWVVLYRDHATGKLENLWVNEHDTGHLVLGAPILIMDVFEHAYLTQFGLEKARYIELFLQSIHWDVVHRRLECL